MDKAAAIMSKLKRMVGLGPSKHFSQTNKVLSGLNKDIVNKPITGKAANRIKMRRAMVDSLDRMSI